MQATPSPDPRGKCDTGRVSEHFQDFAPERVPPKVPQLSSVETLDEVRVDVPPVADLSDSTDDKPRPPVKD